MDFPHCSCTFQAFSLPFNPYSIKERALEKQKQNKTKQIFGKKIKQKHYSKRTRTKLFTAFLKLNLKVELLAVNTCDNYGPYIIVMGDGI